MILYKGLICFYLFRWYKNYTEVRPYPGHFNREKMVTAFDVKYGKPHPEPYLMGLQKAHVKPNEAFVVTYCKVLMSMPAFAMFVQKVCRNT